MMVKRPKAPICRVTPVRAMSLPLWSLAAASVSVTCVADTLTAPTSWMKSARMSNPTKIGVSHRAA